ncbi:hypothetical protein GCM10027615_16460 [Plantactinospora veratri]
MIHDRGVTAGGADVGFRAAPERGTSVARARGHEVAWGSDTGGQHGSTTEEVRGKGGLAHRWIARRRPQFRAGADTAASIEREVVSGHAYAILAPVPGTHGRCGYDKPAVLPVDGVFDP